MKVMMADIEVAALSDSFDLLQQEGAEGWSERLAKVECDVADAESVRSRAYPLSHYTYLYFAGRPTDTLRAFQAFVVSEEGQEIVEQSGGLRLPLGG